VPLVRRPPSFPGRFPRSAGAVVALVAALALPPAAGVTAAATASALPTIAAVGGVACVHRDPWVCTTPAGRIALRLTLTPAGAAAVAPSRWSFEEIATAATLTVPSGRVVAGVPVSLGIDAVGAGELDLMLAGQVALVLYVGASRLPPWPGTARTADPPANVAPPVLSPFASAAAEELAFVHAISQARRREGLAPLQLPRDFNRLGPVAQLFVLTNLERVARGLWPLWAVSARLDAVARAGAVDRADPVYTVATHWGSTWFSGGDPAQAVWGWMYDDGPGPFDENLDCPTAGAAGCWGHRHVLLGEYGPYGLFGGADVAGGGSTELLVDGFQPVTAGVVYTWAQAVAAGARPAN
jgi:hypothetical protein